MDLIVFENDKPFVINEFREGRFDYVELASDVAETRFFNYLFDTDVVSKLAESYPTPRQRECVPMWMYVSSQISMRLHGSHSFNSYPLIVRSGGLLNALGPDVARHEVDPVTGELKIGCEGFNKRNLHKRETPCDQDFLRKMSKDTDGDQLEDWYNQHVVKVYKDLNAFDSDGLFIADGTYLFVPDNDRYEGSHRLMFDEHNHPVSQDEQKAMTPAQQAHCRWRRYYKAVLLLHSDFAGDRFVVVGLRVLKKKEAESTAVWPMVEKFIESVGPDVMKVLILDRGFLNGEKIGELKLKHNVDTVIPARSDMEILKDVRGLVGTNSLEWEEYCPTQRPDLPDTSTAKQQRERHPTAEKRERTRQETLAKQRAENPPTETKRVKVKTLITRVQDLTSWQKSPVPMSMTYSRDKYSDGTETSWGLVTTNPNWSARIVRDLYRIRPDIEERHRQVKCFWDLTRFHSPARNHLVGQAVFVCLTYSLLQIHLLKTGHEELNRRTVPTTRRLLSDGERVVIYRQQRFAFLTLLEHMELILSLEEKARSRALRTTRKLLKEASPNTEHAEPESEDADEPTATGAADESAPMATTADHLASKPNRVAEDDDRLAEPPVGGLVTGPGSGEAAGAEPAAQPAG